MKIAGLILPHYQKAINEIDDLLEYRYKRLTTEELRAELIRIITKLGNSIARCARS